MQNANMAPWKYVIYAAVGLGVFILLLLLNFDFLPKRMTNTETWTSTTSTWRGSTAAVFPTSASPVNIVSGEMTLQEFNNTKWNCSSNTTSLQPTENANYSMRCYTPQDPSICVNDPLHCNHPYTSGKMQLLWPRYGEYRYLPKSMWILVLRHGGVVFLYHPCTKPDTINRLRLLAKSCLKKYVISPFELLDPVNESIALVSWSCVYTAPDVDTTQGQKWIHEHALKGPATHVRAHGKFHTGLVEPARLLANQEEHSSWCPLGEELKAEYNDEGTPLRDDPDARDDASPQIVVSKTVTRSGRQPFDRYNAAWALGSLLFLCVILGALLMYTKLWNSKDHYWTADMTFDNQVKHRVPKKKRTFFKFNLRGRSSKKHDAYSKLLGTIPEEDSDDI